MASAISKRQAARNERTLNDLTRSIPGNSVCAECSAKNPGWASWNLGVFLCMRCAGLHRKLGTHVSKVKSSSMDSWSTDQVDNMKNVGNVLSNRKYNPKGVRPDIPIDADEVDGALERFMRRKYELREFMSGGGGSGGGAGAMAPARQNTGSTGTGSWNEEPPPLPPKPGKKFGFSLRSASSTLPRIGGKHNNDRNFTPPLSPAFSGSDRSRGDEPSSPHREIKGSNKASQLFGMKITSVSNNFDAKLATLRDMGFPDTRRNSEVLKSSNGNLDRAVEALVRMGEGSTASRTQTPGPRVLTPVSMGSQGVSGITIDKTREPKKVTNPWEQLDADVAAVNAATPQRAATQPLPEPPRSQSAQPQSNSSWNPFLSQQQPQQQSLENSFQNLSMSQIGPPVQQQYAQQQLLQQTNPWQAAPQATTTLWDTINTPQQYQQPQYQQQQQPQVPQLQEQTSNPFLRRAASQTFQQSNPWGQPVPQQQAPQAQQQPSNPFGVPWQQQQAQPQPLQQSYSVFQQPTTASPASVFGQEQYFTQQTQQQPQQQMQQPQYDQQSQWQQTQAPQQQSFAGASNPFGLPQQQPQQPMMPQPTGMPQQQQQYQQPPPQEQPWQYHEVQPQQQQQIRLDKSSILGLYGQQRPQALQPVMENGQQQAFTQPQQQFQPQQQQRSATMPTAMMSGQMQGNSNPFGIPPQVAPQISQVPQGSRHVSNESVAFQGFPQDGRHSPDAFSGLSARYMR